MQPDYAERIARLELQVSFLLQHLGIDPAAASAAGASSPFGSPADIFGTAVPASFGASPVAGSGPGPAPAAAVPPELLNALQRGRMIEAIKIYRNMTGIGLKEAKVAVEGMARDLGVR
jgi:hypothetical protein